MVYDEVGSGGIGSAGCAEIVALHPSVTEFGIGDTLYNAQKARRGILEKVVIKSIRAITSRGTMAAGRVLYTDTFNALWNEWDLVPYDQAMSLVAQYTEKVLDNLQQLKTC